MVYDVGLLLGVPDMLVDSLDLTSRLGGRVRRLLRPPNSIWRHSSLRRCLRLSSAFSEHLYDDSWCDVYILQ